MILTLLHGSSHPYIFFNQDRESITFVGFVVTRNGDLVDPDHQEILEQGIMTQELYTGLKDNKVKLSEDFRQWSKCTMIEKIATVMGVDYPYDPDETYVLTVDNLIKILAIQMRFRCGIPVVIMGETGCGKTRLIQYMCDLARQGEENRNMLIMKVRYLLKQNCSLDKMMRSQNIFAIEYRYTEVQLRLILRCSSRKRKGRLKRTEKREWTLLCFLMKPTPLMLLV